MARDCDHDAAGAPPRFERAIPEPTATEQTAGFGGGRHDTTTGVGRPEADAAPGVRRPRILEASALLGDDRVLHIEHAGEVYTLRLTRNNRLILTK